MISRSVLPYCSFLVTFFPAPAWDLSTGCSSLRITLACVLSTEDCPLGTDCSSVGPSWATVLARKPSPVWVHPTGHSYFHKLFSCLDFSAWATVLARSLLQCGLSMSSQLSARHIYLPQHGILHRVQCMYLLHHGSPWAAG